MLLTNQTGRTEIAKMRLSTLTRYTLLIKNGISKSNTKVSSVAEKIKLYAETNVT